MRRKNGFTLVELLVVIGIIALLISILMPALRKARESAQRAQCLSNIRQMTVGMIMYTNDNQQWFPPLTPGAGYDYGGWIVPVAKYVNANPQPDPSLPPDLRKIPSSSVLFCPAETTGYLSAPYGYHWFYAFNQDMRQDRKISQIKKPSEAFMFMDYAMYAGLLHHHELEKAFWGHSSGTHIAGPSHRGKGVSIAYMDGHAEFWSQAPKTIGEMRTGRGFPWTYKKFWGWHGTSGNPPAAYRGAAVAPYYK